MTKRRFSDYIHYYTDGSKKDEISSYGGYSDQLDISSEVSDKRETLGSFSRRICNNSSIFTAEAEGIKHALRHIRASPSLNGKFVVFSDSKSVLESLQSQNSKNVTIKEVNEQVQYIYRHSNKTLEFCWVPSHRKIEGNEKADKAAERARGRLPDSQYELPYTDLYPLVESFIQQKWQHRWETADSDRPNKLFAIQPEIGPFDIQGLSRKEETIIHRLRIGHTRLTHSHG